MLKYRHQFYGSTQGDPAAAIGINDGDQRAVDFLDLALADGGTQTGPFTAAAGYIEGVVIPFHAHIVSQLQAAAQLIPAHIATEQPLSTLVCIENGDNDIVLTYEQIATLEELC